MVVVERVSRKFDNLDMLIAKPQTPYLVLTGVRGGLTLGRGSWLRKAELAQNYLMT